MNGDTKEKPSVDIDEEASPLWKRFRFPSATPGILAPVTVALAIIVALFVPPVSLLERLAVVGYQTLGAQKVAVEHPDGLILRVDPESSGSRFRVKLEAIPRAEFLQGSAGPNLRTAAEALPTNLEVKSPCYTIETRGKPAQPIWMDVAIPNGAKSLETLDLYTWDGEQWSWMGSELHTEVSDNSLIRAEVTEVPASVILVESESKAPMVSTYLDPDDNLRRIGPFDVVNPTGLLLGTMGGFAGNVEGLVVPECDRGCAVVPTLRNWAPGGSVNAGLLSGFLTDPAAQQTHIDNTLSFCTERGFDGVEIDYRGVAPDQRDAYASFVRSLAETLHKADLWLSVVVESPASVNGEWDPGGYDLAAIGRAADAVKVPFPADPKAFAEGGKAHRLLDWVTAQVSRHKVHMLVSSLSTVTTEGSTVYEPIPLEEALAPLGQVEALGNVEEVEPGAEVAFKLSGSLLSAMPWQDAGTYRIRYAANGGEVRTLWLGTAACLAHKLRWAERYHIGGVAVADALDPGNMEGVIELIVGYGSGVQTSTKEPMEVAWTVRGADGPVDEETSSLTELPYTWKTPEEAGKFEVGASILGFDHGSLTVTVVEPEVVEEPTETITDTETETDREVEADETEDEGPCLDAAFVADVSVPDNTQFAKEEMFDKTWMVENSGTCAWPEDTVVTFVGGEQMAGPDSVEVGAVEPGQEKEITVPLKAPAEDGSYTGKWQLASDGEPFGGQFWVTIVVGEPQPAQPTPPTAPPPSTGGGFELGGQTHTLAHPNEMHYAGMSWVKFQHKWSASDDPSSVAGRIEQAHANGFKVLLSIPGSDLYPSSIDFSAYVEFLRGVAALGPDAIEIWNEHNLDREWVTGQINPAVYVQKMLAPAYQAIKSVDRDVMVISGAPSPTGAEAAYGLDKVWNDDRYIRGMARAGAAAYADCIGVHYNEGIIPPSQTTGDPRADEYYTRYFWGMVNTYYDAFGGARKLCFTELGYVSDEGYPSLAGGSFDWAKNTTVTQQAAWLAEAASLAASGGKIRMIIVFNVDIGHYEVNDPQAGYAIIRPSGACPACEALHNVLGTR